MNWFAIILQVIQAILKNKEKREQLAILKDIQAVRDHSSTPEHRLAARVVDCFFLQSAEEQGERYAAYALAAGVDTSNQSFEFPGPITE